MKPSLKNFARTLRCEHLEDRRMLTVVTVTTNQDVVDIGDGLTSLREAIFATNLVKGADEIVFDFGHDGPATILLTEGELAITDSLTITGQGADLLTIDAIGSDPTLGGVGGMNLARSHNGSIVIENSAIINNSAVHSAGGINALSSNGGRQFTSKITIFNSTISSNTGAIGGLPSDLAGAFAVTSNFSLIGVGPEFLGPLADNGGPTLTHALLPDSPAIDDGDVDGSDFLNWHRNVGCIALPTQANGDATGNGTVDGNDLAVWQATYGEDFSAKSLAGAVAGDVADDDADQFAQAIDLALTKFFLAAHGKTSRLQQVAVKRSEATEFFDVTHLAVVLPNEIRRSRTREFPARTLVDVERREIPDESLTLEQAIDENFARLWT